MKFASIGSWIDRKLEGAQNSWRGSEAKKTIDNMMEKSKTAVIDTADKVSVTTEHAKSNLDGNLTAIRQENPEKGFFGKAMEVGKQGGFVGLMMKKPESAQQEKVSPEMESPKETQIQQHDGWNITG